MLRPDDKNFSKLLPDSQRLVCLAVEIGRACSRLESRFWENKLEALVRKLLETKKQRKLDDAVEYLARADQDVGGILQGVIESSSESCTMRHRNEDYDVLLVMAPLLAWTRFAIPSGPLAANIHAGLSKAFSESLLADNARFMLAPGLYAVDQLPQSHVEIFSLTKGMAASVMDEPGAVSFRQQDTAPFLADVRYLVFAVCAPASQPVFRWQMASGVQEHLETRKACFEKWQERALPLLSGMMHGCGLELIPPDGFFGASRAADRQIRPLSVAAAIHYLTQMLDVDASDLRAVIGGFAETPRQTYVSEYRIGFSLRDNPQILYGVVWPVYSVEESPPVLGKRPDDGAFSAWKDAPASLGQILDVLEEFGVKCEASHTERFPMDFCEECGVPLFADANAELVHAELPEFVGEEPTLH
ncbi:MAG: DUF2863 family protein [Burkholderiaceae bacterium]|jgi:hypothetical protein|nr:DUF2863 family protein [Burkholderiaceae bacterium]